MVLPLNMIISIDEHSQMRLAEDEEYVHEVGYLQRLTQWSFQLLCTESMSDLNSDRTWIWGMGQTCPWGKEGNKAM